jgi:hypothetical protein
VGVRIGAYVSCLEALFSTDSAELSHKLSERVAVFLSDDPEERVTIYREVKLAYAVRSKIVHGDEMEAKHHVKLLQISSSCDNLLRRVFVRVLKDEAAAKLLRAAKNDIDVFFLERTLGSRD